MMQEITPDNDTYQGKSERVSDPIRIQSLLSSIKESRALLTVTLPGHRDLFNSAILDINPDAAYLILDELNPGEGHVRLSESRQFSAHTRLKGIEISFSGEVAAIGGSRTEGAYYQVPIPRLLHYLQRRSYYRAKVSITRRIPVTFTLANGVVVNAELNDISLGGVGVRLEQASANLNPGTIVPRCHLRLPTHEEIVCEITICFTNVGIHGNHRVVGARFNGLNQAQQNCVSRFIAELDRAQRKRLNAVS